MREHRLLKYGSLLPACDRADTSLRENTKTTECARGLGGTYGWLVLAKKRPHVADGTALNFGLAKYDEFKTSSSVNRW